MLSLTRDLIKKTQEADSSVSTVKIKPLTICFWSDFMANPSIMYDLFAANSRKLDYDPDKVKVMGTKDGMIRYAGVYSNDVTPTACFIRNTSLLELDVGGSVLRRMFVDGIGIYTVRSPMNVRVQGRRSARRKNVVPHL